MIQRFFVPSGWITSNDVTLHDPLAHQITRVLRMQPAEHLLLLDNLGNELEVEITGTGSIVKGVIVDRHKATGEPACVISLFLGLTQREKFEWILQKCTEVGASYFSPFYSSRTLVPGGAKDFLHFFDGRKKRWERIIQEAAEQSGRGIIPPINPPISFEDALRDAPTHNDLVLIPYEGEENLRLVEVIKNLSGNGKVSKLALFIGPEGGFSEDEIIKAKENGAVPVTLGRRILRMETAAIVAVAMALSQLGE